MNINDLESILSHKRLATYYRLFPSNRDRAIAYYLLNTQVSESVYPLLSIFEISLRNAIHHSFSVHFNSSDWFSDLESKELSDQVITAKRKIVASNNHITPDKLVAELTLGFWTTLFNRKYAKDFWKPLMYAFPELDTRDKRRDKISYKLNQARKFRNRVFHYEPICNDLAVLAINYDNLIEILNWIHSDIAGWIQEADRFQQLYHQALDMRV